MKRLIASILLVTSLNAQAGGFTDPGIMQMLSLVAGAYAGNKISGGNSAATIGGAVIAGLAYDQYEESKLKDCPKVDPYGVPPNPYVLPQYRCGRYQ